MKEKRIIFEDKAYKENGKYWEVYRLERNEEGNKVYVVGVFMFLGVNKGILEISYIQEKETGIKGIRIKKYKSELNYDCYYTKYYMCLDDSFLKIKGVAGIDMLPKKYDKYKEIISKNLNQIEHIQKLEKIMLAKASK